MLRRIQSTIRRTPASAASQPILRIRSIIAIGTQENARRGLPRPASTRSGERSLRAQPHDEANGNETDEAIAAEILDHGDDVSDHAAKEGQRPSDKERGYDCQREKHQAHLRERADPRFEHAYGVHSAISIRFLGPVRSTRYT